GSLRVRLDSEERDLLRTLPGQLRELLEETPDDPSLRRLFPPASDDEEIEAEYRRFMAPDLRDHRLGALAVMESTIDAERLSEDEAAAWLSALNDMRLVLGTRLDVTEDLDPAQLSPDDPRTPGLALYGYLSWVVEQLVEALAAS
ncbi:MAG: DUF2017 domain-containing protein, partial [Actinomycetota bacterium]|nr:DUF2017 domain-containing protein [Actinomycetota bacterium]